MPMPYRPLGLILATAIGFAALPAAAAEPADAPPAAEGEQVDPRAQEFIQARRRAQELQQELSQIQQRTLAENEELRQRQQQLQDLVIETMREQGHDPLENLDRLQALAKQLQSKETPAAEKQKLAVEFQQRRQEFEQARQQAFEQDTVRESAEALQEDTLAAMKEVEPRTGELVAELEEQQAALQRLYQQAQQEKAGG